MLTPMWSRPACRKADVSSRQYSPAATPPSDPLGMIAGPTTISSALVNLGPITYICST